MKKFPQFTKKGGDTKPGNEAREAKRGVSPTELQNMLRMMSGAGASAAAPMPMGGTLGGTLMPPGKMPMKGKR